MSIDLETIRKKAVDAVIEFLHGRSSGWRKVSEVLYIKRDGPGLNLWFRGDHAGGEGLFFVPEYELPALAEAFGRLAEEHIKVFEAQYKPQLPATDQKELLQVEKARKAKSAG